jgi:hypothetical protein
MHWTREESECLESLAGDYPLREVVNRYHRRAGQEGWPVRSKGSIRMRLWRLGYGSRVRYGQWLTNGAVGEILGCPGNRVRMWFWGERTSAILEPKFLGNAYYVSRKAWRRLAKDRPEVLGGFPADRLFQLLEDRELAESVAARFPRHFGDWSVRCVETGQVWRSAVAAGRELHVAPHTITLAIRQRRPVTVLALRFEALREVA